MDSMTKTNLFSCPIEAPGTGEEGEENNVAKLIVLTMIIVFTLIGNIGVVLAILLRR